MPIEEREHASVVTHALAQTVLTDLRDQTTDRPAFRTGLERLGELCGSELIDARFDTEPVTVETPLATTEGVGIAGREDVVLVSVLRAATPFVEGLLAAFPDARQGVISASRDEAAGMTAAGEFPIEMEYAKLPEIRPGDAVVVADPMLATGSTMVAVLDAVLGDAPEPDRLIVLSAVSAPAGLERVREAYPAADLVTVAIDDELDERGFIVPGLGDAGDRAFGSAE